MAHKKRSATVRAGSRPGDRARIVIVDDHPALREGLAAFFENEGNVDVCGQASDARGTLARLEESRPDLVVIDLSLESDSGLDLVKQIAARYPDVKILVYSMHDEKVYAERVLHAGAHGYVGKHEDFATLRGAVDTVLAGKVHLSEQMTGLVLERQIRGGAGEGLPSTADLTDRELEVFERIGRGLSTREIAEQLHLSVKTIESHRENIKRKLAIETSVELLQRAVRWHIDEC